MVRSSRQYVLHWDRPSQRKCSTWIRTFSRRQCDLGPCAGPTGSNTPGISKTAADCAGLFVKNFDLILLDVVTGHLSQVCEVSFSTNVGLAPQEDSIDAEHAPLAIDTKQEELSLLAKRFLTTTNFQSSLPLLHFQLNPSPIRTSCRHKPPRPQLPTCRSWQGRRSR